MNRGTLTIMISIFVLCTVALCMMLAARKVSGQNAGAQTSAQAYNPYPPRAARIHPKGGGKELA
jgi:hypothetical protein